MPLLQISDPLKPQNNCINQGKICDTGNPGASKILHFFRNETAVFYPQDNAVPGPVGAMDPSRTLEERYGGTGLTLEHVFRARFF